MHGIDIGPTSCGSSEFAVRSELWTEPLFGEGPTSGYDHVMVTGNGSENIPPRGKSEYRQLRTYWDDDEIFPESRLATEITVKDDMDGMIIYVPDRLDHDHP